MDVDVPSAGFSDLPIELHEQIIGYLPWDAKLNLEHVCRVWRQVIRKRHSGGRFSIAPWLPQQSFELAYYNPLKIHSLLLDGKTLTFKCQDKYEMLGSPCLVDESLIKEIFGALDGVETTTVKCISSLQITDKVQQPQAGSEGSSEASSQQSTFIAPPITTPIANLSILNEMAIECNFFTSEDMITKLHCQFSIMDDVEVPQATEKTQDENSTGENTQETTQDTTQATTQEATEETAQQAAQENIQVNTQENTQESIQENTEASTTPAKITTRMAVSNGTFVCDVIRDDGVNWSCLTLGKLLLEIRQNLVSDIVSREELDDEDETASNGDSDSDDGGDEGGNPQPQQIVDPVVLASQKLAKAERKKAIEDATIVIQGLHFVRGAGSQALTIVFDAEVISESPKVAEMEANQGNIVLAAPDVEMSVA